MDSTAGIVRAPPQELIASLWMRQLLEKSDHHAMDRNLVLLIAHFSENEFSVRLTRPLSLGTAEDMHHLHIRQIEVFSSETGELCNLRFQNASPCVKRGHDLHGKLRTPLCCIDGDKSYSSYNHNDYSDRGTSNSESHWMEFDIVRGRSPFIDFPVDVGRVVIHNRVRGCQRRIVGCVLELKCDGDVLKKWTVDTAISTWQTWSAILGY